MAIEVEGLRELNFAVRRAVDSEIPKRVGQANKAVGQLVISRLTPRPVPEAVGAGSGAAVRASASKREVQLRVGGAHRAAHSPQAQWGKKVVRAFRPAPDRPFILGTAEREQGDIESAYLQALGRALFPAFADSDL
ncbi:MAG: hypothetical protein M3O70_08900 [Actinomycetota bacterium]|nr:hypothetical protein [Actinomycetota bacterium]